MKKKKITRRTIAAVLSAAILATGLLGYAAYAGSFGPRKAGKNSQIGDGKGGGGTSGTAHYESWWEPVGGTAYQLCLYATSGGNAGKTFKGSDCLRRNKPGELKSSHATQKAGQPSLGDLLTSAGVQNIGDYFVNAWAPNVVAKISFGSVSAGQYLYYVDTKDLPGQEHPTPTPNPDPDPDPVPEPDPEPEITYYSTTFVFNDGTGNTSTHSGQTAGETYYAPSAYREGYRFNGWYDGFFYVCGSGGSYTQEECDAVYYGSWEDDTPPSCNDLTARPNTWSAGDGSVTWSMFDEGSGLSSAVLMRYSLVDHSWTTVWSDTYGGTNSTVYGSYEETDEGVFYYRLTITDVAGNTTTRYSETIYLDHSAPDLIGLQNVYSDWTNIAPVISVRGTDYLDGTTYEGSGVKSITIYDERGRVVASGDSRTSYTLKDKDEGIHSWTVEVYDNVGHHTEGSVTTKYDKTLPGIDGTEKTTVINSIKYSGYCEDNIIKQHIDDEAWRSPNNPNCTSGLKNVILYSVKDGVRTAISSKETRKSFSYPDTHSYFDMYYDTNLLPDTEHPDYYLIVVRDFAGNLTKKKLIMQRDLLTWFHTSIDRRAYN